MKLTKIEIEEYKSIKAPVTISFIENLPTVLIGKNGSGKTNVLEALFAIASNNTPNPRHLHNHFGYKAYIQLSKKYVESTLPTIEYDEGKCKVLAYNSGDGLIIDRLYSEYIVPLLKKEIADIRELAFQLKEAVDTYRKQITKIFHEGYEEVPLCCYELKDAEGSVTNFHQLSNCVDYCVKQTETELEKYLQSINEDENAITFLAHNLLHTKSFSANKKQLIFRLEYKEPALANFEQKYISINRTAIKREITKINKRTEESCERINRLIKEIEDRNSRIMNTFDVYYVQDWERDGSYGMFLRDVKNVFGRKCLFLKSESNDVIFRKDYRDLYYYDNSNSIIETYLRHVYDGSDKEELLKSTEKLTLSEQAVADFEVFLNENIPSFDREMYDSISVQESDNGNFSIFLNEKTGEQINLNETSAGRRWYFTYYFMKNRLEKGDIFIIDEPAAMLHPSAQREILNDLIELTKQGVKVVYSTHSPYLVPNEWKWKCVHFVTMTEEGTEVNCVSSNEELVSQMTNIVGEDIFDFQSVLEKYFTAPPDVVAKNISDLIRETQKKRGIKSLQTVCDEIGIEYQAMKSWNRLSKKQNGEKNKKFNSPSIPNIVKVLQWAKKVQE